MVEQPQAKEKEMNLSFKLNGEHMDIKFKLPKYGGFGNRSDEFNVGEEGMLAEFHEVYINEDYRVKLSFLTIFTEQPMLLQEIKEATLSEENLGMNRPSSFL
ncbi:hypothetical protein SAMN04489761_2060 [Tenacibaculum sp. MAR_2009_124]|nr:hypothetical protein SAMN04489761_2060 [Tenacibaculum sp. MAR_2009_124]